ncbi:hypothetical protein HDU84_006939 [Entophlyctis sp. JEL0112]|nr:hypothetical protein HDU84_006939 [Entophlyctis sp. JEL0112]
MAAPFPIAGTLPKQARYPDPSPLELITSCEGFDGRGTVIAILDTGVDPAAIGMQQTTTGLRKIIELIDCTGSGDVDMKTSVTADVDEQGVITLKGLTGRTLKVPTSWPVPSDKKYRVGWKDSASLFPNDLSKALASKRLDRFNREHHALVAGAKEGDALEALKAMKEDFKDPGQVWDVIALHDGTKWRAAIDINETGDFENAKLLAAFNEEFEYGSFGDDTRLSYSLGFYDDGDLLSIVTLSGTHGTHVAAIAAANHPHEPLQNGVAPGAQIISLKIGDSRLGSQETCQSLVRAACELARLKPDVANISYGEPGANYNYGRFIEILQEEVVRKQGCVVVAAAGNSGPVLSSVGHPSGNNGILSVGAYLTENLEESSYALLNSVPERPFSFSSMGPTLDGAIGVDIYAPGGAITSVPEYTKNSVQLMNGTSMASPNAAGCVSLLISALKQNQIQYNPYRIHLALRNTSKDVGDPFKVGMIQVESAWNHLFIASLHHNLDVLYDIKVGGNNRGRGLYLRTPEETTHTQRQTVKITPLFAKPLEVETSAKMLEFEAKVNLVCSAPWIQAPEFVLIANSGREFLFNVDPSELGPGLHVGDILGYDTNLRGAGPLFKIPITICKANLSADKSLRKFNDLEFDSGEIKREFIDVPPGANFATISVRSKDRIGNSAFWLTFQQINNQTPYTAMENSWTMQLSSTTSDVESDEFKWVKKFRVAPNLLGELVMCQYCTSLGKTSVSVTLEFHGLEVSAGHEAEGGFGSKSSGDLLFINSGNASLTRCDIHSRLRKESITAVSASLDTLQKSLRPNEAGVIAALKSRDMLPDGRQLFELVLNYTLKVAEDSKVLPFYPPVMNTVYDSFFESVWIFVFDSKKALQSIHDIKSRPVSLKEGTYSVKMQLVSRSIEVLEKLKNAPILINFEVKSVTLSAYKTLGGLISDGEKVSSISLAKGESTPFWLSGVEGSALPKSAAPGDLLFGNLKVVDAIGIHKIAYLVPSEIAKAKETVADALIPALSNQPNSVETKPDELQEAIRDLKISHLKKMEAGEKRDALVKELEAEHGAHVPFLIAKLEVQAAAFEKAPSAETQKLVESAIGAILDVIDRKSLAVYFGLNHDSAAAGENGKKVAKEVDCQKEAVVLALLWNARLAKYKITSNSPSEELELAFDKSLVELSEWLATTDGKYLALWAWRLLQKKKPWAALKAIVKYCKDGKNEASGNDDKAVVWRELVEMKKKTLQDLGCDVWVRVEVAWALRKAPPSFALF